MQGSCTFFWCLIKPVVRDKIMEKFFIDKFGDDDSDEGNEFTNKNDHNVISASNFSKIDLLEGLPNNALLSKEEFKSRKSDVTLDSTYLITSYKNPNANEAFLSNVDKLLGKSVIQQGFEQCHSVPSEKTKKALIRRRKKLREKTKGKNWFDIPAVELTEEIKTDFELLKMRSVLDRKHVYKKNNITKIPKYFQVGKVIESPADFYGGRIVKSLRKKTMVDELLADAEFKKYQKKKFKEIMDENRRKKRTNKILKEKAQKKKFKR